MDRAIYVHWPFCVSKCPYCDFNSHVRESVDQDRWRAALLREIAYWQARAGQGPINSIFFGGGTPSLMPPETVGAVIDAISSCFGLADDIEITLEANPSSVEAGRFQDFNGAGVNRLSLGVQSFDDASLKFLGRAHDAASAHAAIEIAQRTFGRFSFDMIYALPAQSEAEWRVALQHALDLSAGHLSLYQLTIEPNTGFAGAVKRGRIVPMEDDPAADLFDLTQQMCAEAGMPAYETSNHAAPGLESRHNQTYWQYGSWIGIGPGAHGRVCGDQRHATANLKRPEVWLEQVETVGHGLAEDRELEAAEQAEEAFLMGLRLAEGIDAARFYQATGVTLESVLDTESCEQLMGKGLVAWDGQRLLVEPPGRLLLNAITGALLAGNAGA